MSGAFFDAYAAGYRQSVERSVGFMGRDLDFFHRRKVDVLLGAVPPHLGPLRRVSVLDVGCGTGVTDAYLRPHVRSLVGVDVSDAMVEEASRRNPDCEYRTYDGEHLPWRDGAFDLVLTICVLHHVPPATWPAFVSELARVTRPGGVVAIIEHNRVNPLTRRAVRQCPFDEDAVLVAQHTATALLDGAGAGPPEVHNFLFSPFAGRFGRWIDRCLGSVPVGGQYLSLGRRRSPGVALAEASRVSLPAPVGAPASPDDRPMNGAGRPSKPPRQHQRGHIQMSQTTAPGLSPSED
jgi:SAM-dependent methyltransferase